MLVAAVTQHLGQLVQEPLSAALRTLLNSYPQMLQKAAHSGGASGSATALYAEFQHQVQQVGLTSQMQLTTEAIALGVDLHRTHLTPLG